MRFISFLLVTAIAYLFSTASEAKSDSYRIVALGNSLTEGYQLSREEAYPAQLESLLKEGGYDVVVINHGISGDTTAGGRSRIDHSLEEKPDLVILELGPNDFLRGIAPSATRNNLEFMLKKLRSAAVDVLLVGFKAAPNIGPAYKEQFDKIFPELAEAYDAVLYMHFLDGVAGDAELNLSDGIHPNKAGYAIVARNLLPYVERFLSP